MGFTYKCPYPDCNYMNTGPSRMEGHIRAKHRNNPFVCLLGCGAKMSSQGVLKRHMEKHLTPDGFNCDACSISFNSRQRLWEHNRMVHTENPGYFCKLCGKRYLYRSGLSVHMKRDHHS